jgi:4-deoxy-L-threo-5-hexosulose-uronate ketol-isomerase
MMHKEFESRYALSPTETKQMDTQQLREQFLIDGIFEADAVRLTLTHYDRYIAGGVMPVHRQVGLPNPDALKAEYFLERRELGIINVGGPGTVLADGISFALEFKEALYIGKGTREVSFASVDAARPAKFYINSAPAHQSYPTKKVNMASAEIVELDGDDGA